MTNPHERQGDRRPFSLPWEYHIFLSINLRGYLKKRRHVLVDTQGNIVALKVTTADVQDRDGAQLPLNVFVVAFEWLKLIWADGGCAGKLVGHVAGIARHRKIKFGIVKRSDDVKGLRGLPKRWIVERTFGWLIQSRWLV
jgi:transposase